MTQQPAVTLELPPDISPENPMPTEWTDGIDRHRSLWEKAEEQHYNANTGPDWAQLQQSDFSERQRVGLAYWFATNGAFENTGVPTFAYAMVKAYERHLGDSSCKALLTVARDEANHDEMSRRVVETLLPGFPNRAPESELEAQAANNLRWIHYTNSLYWDGYKKAFESRSLPGVLSPFIVGEAAAALIYMATSKRATHPTFSGILHNIGVDEARHFAFCNFLSQATWGELPASERDALTRNIKAAYVYLSAVFGEPRGPFWKVPAYFRDVHRTLEEAAADGGLGILPPEERNDLWRKGMLRVKSVSDRFEIPFPQVEELGIEGTEIALTEEDLMVVSF